MSPVKRRCSHITQNTHVFCRFHFHWGTQLEIFAGIRRNTHSTLYVTRTKCLDDSAIWIKLLLLLMSYKPLFAEYLAYFIAGKCLIFLLRHFDLLRMSYPIGMRPFESNQISIICNHVTYIVFYCYHSTLW